MNVDSCLHAVKGRDIALDLPGDHDVSLQLLVVLVGPTRPIVRTTRSWGRLVRRLDVSLQCWARPTQPWIDLITTDRGGIHNAPCGMHNSSCGLYKAGVA